MSELLDKVNSHTWYHRIKLTDAVTTPGNHPIHHESYRIPTDLAGKRVLDIGSWDGYWAFEALKRGASQVVAIDDFSDDPFKVGRENRWETFDLCREVLGYSEKQCQRREMSLYDLKPETFGMFDVVFMFGVVYHCRHPQLALDIASSVCKSEIYIESAIIDNFSPYKGFSKTYENQMVMEFYPTIELGDNNSNWWAPSMLCLGHMVKASGFDDVCYWKLTTDPQEVPHCRGFVKGVKK